jgi:RNA polymerase sigma-70 factor (ECF subfamily)
MTADIAAAHPPRFDTLLQQHKGIVLKIAASWCEHPADRADLAQDIALQLWRAWPTWDTSRPFATWMYRIALNVAISHKRCAGSRPAHDAIDDEHAHIAGAADVDTEAREQLEHLQRAMRALGPLDRALLLLHLDGNDHATAGEVLGVSAGNVATRLTRIRERLRQLATA